MSYSTVNGMRSTRFPLQGDCGCGCGGRGDCKPRLGQDSTEQMIQGAGAGGLLLILGFGALLIAGASGGRRSG